MIALLSAGGIAGLLMQQRAEAIEAGGKLVSAFTQLADEQTARTLQIAEQTLRFAEVRLADDVANGSATEGSMRAILRGFLANAPFLKAIRVLDQRGRVVYDSDTGSIDLDLSDQPFFPRHRDEPALSFHVERPLKSPTTGEWILPVTRPLRQADGSFAGVMVAALDPAFFDHIWTLGRTPGTVVALFRDDGTMILRSPLDYTVIGRTLAGLPRFEQMKTGEQQGTFEVTTPFDGEPRILGYRRLGAYPQLIITVAVMRSSALEGWRNAVLISVAGWMAIVAAVGGLMTLLAREWKERRAADERSRMLFEASPYPVYALDNETLRFAAVNDAAVAQYGWSREEFLAMGVNELYPPEALPAIRQSRRQLMATLTQDGTAGETQVLEGMRHRTKSGELIDVELNVRLTELDGKPATLVMARNVTDRVRAERAREAAERQARESQERYRMLFESNPYPVVVTDLETLRLLDVNDAFVELFGASRAALLGMVADDFYAPEDLAAVSMRRRALLEDASHTVRGIRYRRKDGSVIEAETGVRFIDYRGRPAVMTIIVDVTERMRSERARRVAEEQLRQSQKMEAVGQLTGGVAHDFNNILTIILANTDALREEEQLAPEVAVRLERIAQAVERASSLTRQLLVFSRKQPLRLASTDINDLVISTGSLLQRTLGARIEIEQKLALDLWRVSVDRAQLETSLINLCVNARDAMPDGGRLTIETANAPLDDAYVARHPDARTGEHAMLAVTDTGTGMPPDVVARVFEPFFTTKTLGKGTGLGLSMVYGFIKQSKGHITVESEPGRGTSFRLYLPRDKTEAAVAPADDREEAPSGGHERILVVEDETEVRRSAVLQLQSLGYTVAEAANGDAGLAACEAAVQSADASAFDLLLTDVVMPGRLNGKTLADEVRRRWPGTPVVFMSGYSDAALVQDGRLAPGVLLLSKPYKKTELARIVRQALEQAKVGA